ncbi:MAG: DUF167 domain-containing protein [Candidatus Sumerlaeia bacterium]|nr:DUF167 domain-containing protein [Candidatus Sumerlaeia bacterium]
MSAPAAPVESCEGGTLLHLHVTPKARREGFGAVHDGRLKVSVAAPPEDGKANDAVRRLVAKALGLPLSRVELLRGATDRRKTLRLDAVGPEAVRAALGLAG